MIPDRVTLRCKSCGVCGAEVEANSETRQMKTVLSFRLMGTCVEHGNAFCRIERGNEKNPVAQSVC